MSIFFSIFSMGYKILYVYEVDNYPKWTHLPWSKINVRLALGHEEQFIGDVTLKSNSAGIRV